MNLQALDQGYAGDAFPPKVEFSTRPLRLFPDVVCGLMFVLAVAAHLIGGFVILGSTNYEVNLTQGLNSTIGPSESLQQALDDCNAATGGRRLQLLLPDAAPGVFGLFARAPEIPIVIILLVPIIAVIWIGLLTRFARTIVWGTVALSICVYAAMGVVIQVVLEDGNPTVAILMYVCAGIAIIVAYFTRAKIEMAAKHLGMACSALQQIPHVFAAAAVPEVVLIAFLALHWYFCIQAQFVLEVTPTCGVQAASWVSNYIIFMTIAMLWVLSYMNMAKLEITAMAVGHWYFNDPDSKDRRGVGWTGLKFAFSKSFGTIALSAIFTTIADFIISQVNTSLWWTNPLNCFLKCILLCFEGFIKSLTRYCVVAHSVTGRDFAGSAKAAYGVLKRNFVGGYVTDRVGQMVVSAGAYTFSMALGFAAWGWIDSVTGIPTLSGASQDSNILFFVMCLLYLYLLRYPILSVTLVIMLSTALESLSGGLLGPILVIINTLLAALFVASVSYIILGYQGKIILNAMDTIFLCHAVGREANLPVAHAEVGNMYVLLDSNPEYLAKSDMPVAQAIA